MSKLLASRGLAAPVMTAVASLLTLLALSPRDAQAVATPVDVFPIPGGQVASPKTQITFRGLSASQLGSIVVSGSRSGFHSGRLLPDSDGDGGSFVPLTRFDPGETVTVQTALNIEGTGSGTFQFTTATPAGGIHFRGLPAAPRVRGDVLRFHSRPDLRAASVTVLRRSSRAAPGYIFVGTQAGPVRNGPMILDSRGKVVWYKPLPPIRTATDFRVQQYQGKPVLTWWQGFIGPGVGFGDDVIDDSSYHQIAVVHASNGVSADLHEFQLSGQGTALITAYYPVIEDASAAHANKHQVVLDSIVQEIDISTGLVLFQWDSLDHVPLTDNRTPPPKGPRAPLDYFHVNSVDQDSDGNLVISARNTSSVYKVDHRTGAVIWTLGGSRSSFRMGRGTQFAFQHDVRVRPNNLVTLFDDGAGPPLVHRQSRGIALRLDLAHLTAALVSQYQHSPALLAFFEGSMQQLPGGDSLVGWGQQPYFTEFDSRDRTVFDARFAGANSSYRTYRFRWTGAPLTLPAVAASNRGPTTTVYASWNGATDVAAWRVLSGSRRGALRRATTFHKTGFETAIDIDAARYVAVQALDRAGHTLSTSATIRSR